MSFSKIKNSIRIWFPMLNAIPDYYCPSSSDEISEKFSGIKKNNSRLMSREFAQINSFKDSKKVIYKIH